MRLLLYILLFFIVYYIAKLIIKSISRSSPRTTIHGSGVRRNKTNYNNVEDAKYTEIESDEEKKNKK